ncbi:hypothetical protein [Xanthomonas sacchari]|uniref:hypothetical protein n=1 Tax=Xanthomonas sacchari TaxID=56458 RepID=UPI00225C3668|nr:hypothetical protein [Xanthomonas sacchari]
MNTPQLYDLKATLPNFPEEVLRDWLLPYAISEGWPPFAESGLPRGSRWPYLLGKKPKNYWTSTNWSLHHGHITLEQLDPRTQETIAQIIFAAVKGEKNLYSNSIPDLKERFDHIFSHLTFKGTLPGAPTLLTQDDGYRVVDGNHRIAAYTFYCYAAKAQEVVVQPQRFWVGAI